MGKSGLGITDGSKTLCQILLEKERTVPQGHYFVMTYVKKLARRYKTETRLELVKMLPD
jgi:hypothetical protein